MKILVCARIGLDGEINPFDACAYELALSVKDAEVCLLSMGPESNKNTLLSLTRLGGKTAYLLSDTAFAGADTLATAYTLSLAVEKIKPDYIFCGRQTLIGDTAQTGVMLSYKVGFHLITNVMGITAISEHSVSCKTRDEGDITASAPALLTVERINTLRLPSIRSKVGEVKILSAEDIKADVQKCGLAGSPTRVIETKENNSGRRKCEFVAFDRLDEIIKNSLNKTKQKIQAAHTEKKINKVLCVTKAPIEYAKSVSDNVVFCDNSDVDEIIEAIKVERPDAVLFGSDSISKRVSALIAARLDLGLCADCTALQTDGETLYMIRPALSGSVIAKIKSLTKPAMATVRTNKNSSDIVVAAGYGAKNYLDSIKAFADHYSAQLGASRKAVDNDMLPYELQVGLTGKTVSPSVYIAIGISGAIHHIVGMDKAGTVIAINPNKDAPIFEYADYGIVSEFKNRFIYDM